MGMKGWGRVGATKKGETGSERTTCRALRSRTCTDISRCATVRTPDSCRSVPFLRPPLSSTLTPPSLHVRDCPPPHIRLDHTHCCA